MTDPSPDRRVEQLLRESAPHVLGAVVRRFRDFAAAEDAVQEAMIAAVAQWPRDGIPDNPHGWLVQVACRRMSDLQRSELARRNREQTLAAESAFATAVEPVGDFDPDDTLILLFMCCHPALTPASAVAITLRAVGGLTTTEIARAFLVPETTIGQRISRAKQSIRSSGVPFGMPDDDEWLSRVSSVLHVLYLIFNEGYTTGSGDTLYRTDLSNEAIRLTREVCRLLPASGDAEGLLALMLLTDARRAARTGVGGELIPLDEQDRSLWNREAIAEGIARASAALSKGSVGEFQLQATIAAVHDEAERADQTDWPQIVVLYGMLMQLTPSPLVALNHAIATAMVDGPEAGLALIAPLCDDGRLRANHRLDAARAHLMECAGRFGEARELYALAASRTTSIPERNYLIMKGGRLRDS